MYIHELHAPHGARKRKKRLGRGNASGHGTYAGKGQKGQKSRSGGNIKPGFEGGQTPLIRRMPKRKGFTAPMRMQYAVVNIRILNEKFENGETVSQETLTAKGLCRPLLPIKILGDGACTKNLTISVHKLSKSAEEKLQKAGCTISLIAPAQKHKQETAQK